MDTNYVYPGNHFYDTIIKASTICEDSLRQQKNIRIKSGLKLKSSRPPSGVNKVDMQIRPDSGISGFSRPSTATYKEISSRLVPIEREKYKDKKLQIDIDDKDDKFGVDDADLHDRAVI